LGRTYPPAKTNEICPQGCFRKGEINVTWRELAARAAPVRPGRVFFAYGSTRHRCRLQVAKGERLTLAPQFAPTKPRVIAAADRADRRKS
jgi:hypothetical protein